tara:strand:+ start:200 stop:733 length:534 start_codon:yes stop_codon:yes gene_type:complete
MWKDEKRGMFNHRSKEHFLFDKFAEELKDIINFCEQNLKQYMEEIEGVNTDLVTLRITQSWLNKTKPGEKHHQHSHPNSYLSGVLYIKCLPNDCIEYINRSDRSYDNMQFPVIKATVWNSQNMLQGVKEGDLILFHSWLPHSVNENTTNDNERISLAFNTFPTGEMGTDEGLTYLEI